jgi:transcriptional regulator with XRE-family HTH domain
MKFCEKLKHARNSAGMTQEALGAAVGLTKRTIINYETGSRYPRERDVYIRLAQTLGVETNYLLTEDEEFITEAGTKYGDKGEREARDLLQRTSALFAGGELDDEDKLAFLLEIQELYIESKENAKKYVPKKRRKE